MSNPKINDKVGDTHPDRSWRRAVFQPSGWRSDM